MGIDNKLYNIFILYKNNGAAFAAPFRFVAELRNGCLFAMAFLILCRDPTELNKLLLGEFWAIFIWRDGPRY